MIWNVEVFGSILTSAFNFIHPSTKKITWCHFYAIVDITYTSHYIMILLLHSVVCIYIWWYLEYNNCSFKLYAMHCKTCGLKVMPLMWDILYLCGWKVISQLSIYMRYIVPLRLENHMPVYPITWDILYFQSMNLDWNSYSSHQLFKQMNFINILLVLYQGNIHLMGEPVNWISYIYGTFCTEEFNPLNGLNFIP